MTEFLDLETQDVVRMPWNVLPGTKQVVAQCIITISAIYTPLTPLPKTTPLLLYSPLRCRNCRSVLNPFSIVDFSTKTWICSFCLTATTSPTTTNQSQRTISQPNSSLNTCIIEEEIGFLRSGLPRAIGQIPGNSLVGLITFGSKDQVLEQMGFFLKKARPATGGGPGTRDAHLHDNVSRFLLLASECEFAINPVLDELQKDSWPVPGDQRAARCTGTALIVAVQLLGACVPGSNARIMVFLGGPSSEGSGCIVSKSLSEPIRSHKDLDKDSSPYYHREVKLYEGLSKQLLHQGHVLDVFACAVVLLIRTIHLHSSYLHGYRLFLSSYSTCDALNSYRAEPALLDIASIAPNRILLLDSYFTVIVFHGSTIAQWRKAGYQNEPEHELLRAPVDDVKAIVKERFHVPV
ncbi:hypothetical protein L2E82_41207 [Cichorium intybus]|uniref:Uncharacterized protein n=1 Tax=Cichorium intybus TaxID=13427 RepID=A0ACB9AP32_CICIN|nr:hypothetical protein L2E82_41207 [Cichorium intybus]